jgi:nucleotide-binding universal stress UspA family protein
MYDRILVPTDGSSVAEAAVETAVALGGRFGADLHVAHVLELADARPAADDETVAELVEAGERAVARLGRLAGEYGVDATTEVIEGRGPVPLHRSILDAAAEFDADCVVMGTHGRTGLERALLGSVTARTLREASIPVVTVDADSALYPEATVDRLLVPTDGDDAAAAAFDHAETLAASTGATLYLVHVINTRVAATGNLGLVLSQLEESGEAIVEETVTNAERLDPDRIESALVRGSPDRSIVRYAADYDVDCIVMGTHGRSGIERYVLGSVAERVVRIADVPVVVLGASAAEE